MPPQAQVVAFLELYFISVRPLDVLNRHQQERKVRLVCSKHELGHVGCVWILSALEIILIALRRVAITPAPSDEVICQIAAAATLIALPTTSCRHVPSTALASICRDLGVTLSPEELREAFSVLRVGGKVADDGRVLLRIDDLVAMWLLD
jgi:hypothetical protein